MRQPLIIAGILTMLLFTGLNGCIGPLATETVTRAYAATDDTVVTVSSFNGLVDIAGWNGATVTITAVKKSSFGQEDLNSINVSVVEIDNRLDIVTTYTGQRTMKPSVDMTIKVPYNVTIDSVATSNGAILVSGTKGDTVLSTSNGAILVENVAGFVSAATSNGYIQINGTTGISGAHTSNAAISAEVRDIESNISIETSNAVITVYINPSLNATLEMATSNAKVTVEGISLNVSLLEETHIIGTLGADGHKIDIRTSNANINVYKL